MSYDIEMLWQCSLCRARGNRGLKDRYCCNCGHKKDDSDTEYMPDDMSEAAALTGEEAHRAGAGRDWICKFCDSLQNRSNKCCGNCGATERGTKEQSVRTEAPIEFDATPIDTEAPRRSWFQFWFRRAAGRIAATTTVLLVIWFGMWLFLPRDVATHVSAAHWQHDTVIERYAVYPKEGWYPSGDAMQVVPLGTRVHHYDHVHVGSHRESYQDSYTCGETCTTSPSYTTCSSNGNGTARCTQHGGSKSCSPKTCYRTAYRTVQDYEDQPRYQMWFGWRAWDWGYNRTVRREGATSPTWPTDPELRPERISDGEKERSERQASYKVTFREDDGDTHDIEPKTVEEFLKYPTGASVKLRVNRAGSVEVLP